MVPRRTNYEACRQMWTFVKLATLMKWIAIGAHTPQPSLPTWPPMNVVRNGQCFGASRVVMLESGAFTVIWTGFLRPLYTIPTSLVTSPLVERSAKTRTTRNPDKSKNDTTERTSCMASTAMVVSVVVRVFCEWMSAPSLMNDTYVKTWNPLCSVVVAEVRCDMV